MALTDTRPMPTPDDTTHAHPGEGGTRPVRLVLLAVVAAMMIPVIAVVLLAVALVAGA